VANAAVAPNATKTYTPAAPVLSTANCDPVLFEPSVFEGSATVCGAAVAAIETVDAFVPFNGRNACEIWFMSLKVYS
jgi:hypothetical protein